MNAKLIGRRIVRLRKKQNLSQLRLATLAGVDQGGLWRLEAGQVENPKLDTMRRLARALSVPLDSLVNGTTCSRRPA